MTEWTWQLYLVVRKDRVRKTRKGKGLGSAVSKFFFKTTPFTLAINVNKNLFFTKHALERNENGSNLCDYLLTLNEKFKQDNNENVCDLQSLNTIVLYRKEAINSN